MAPWAGTAAGNNRLTTPNNFDDGKSTLRQPLQFRATKLVRPAMKATLALIAAGLFLQGCATNYYACRQQGMGVTTCDERSNGHG